VAASGKLTFAWGLDDDTKARLREKFGHLASEREHATERVLHWAERTVKYKAGEDIEFIDQETFNQTALISHGRIGDGPWWRPGKYEGPEPEFGHSYHRVSAEVASPAGNRLVRFYVPARRLRLRRS
jgi:hypothetical protein